MSKDILYPLRRLHGWLVQQRREHDAKTALQRYLQEGTGMKLLIPGTPEHTNLGDSAILLAQKAFLLRCGITENAIREVTFSQYHKYRRSIPRWIGKNVCVTHLGGGNMGSQWPGEENLHRMIVQDFPDANMIIFPQTIFYDKNAEAEKIASIQVYNEKRNLVMIAREARSFGVMQELYPATPVHLIPDIVLSATMDTFGAKKQLRKGVLLCMRSDLEQSVTDIGRSMIEHAVLETGKMYRYMDMHSDRSVSIDTRQDMVRSKMEEIASAELVITDRLHGMIFAAITGTPCIVFNNCNHKIRGTYEWLQHLPYIRFAKSTDNVDILLPDLLAIENCEFDNTPLLPYFEKLAEVVREYASN